MKKIPWLFLLVLLTSALVSFAHSQPYPTGPVRLVVPLPPGGTLDIAARIIAENLASRLRQPVLVENMGGAGTVLGTASVARAAPDGYTLLMGGTAGLAVNPTLFKSVPYNPIEDFEPVALVIRIPLVLVVHPDLPVYSVSDLVQFVKGRPGELFYASGGAGTQPHLAAELLMATADIEMVHVPYTGALAGVVEVVAGRVQVIFADSGSALPFIETGAVRALGVSSISRLPSATEIPTIAESGFPDFEAVAWIMVVAPAGTPDEVVHLLRAEIQAVIGLPDVRERIIGLGAVPADDSPADLRAFLRSETARWRRVVEQAGLAGSQ